MYISEIKISNFRNFQDTTIEFNEGMNVIIGHNNSGKTNLLKALGLIFNHKNFYRPNVDDFNKEIEINNYLTKTKEANGHVEPPKIRISVIIKESPEKNELTDDLNTVYEWLTKVERPYTAKLTYEFFLPEGEIWKEYQNDIEILEKKQQKVEFWNLIKRKYIRKYISRIYGGDEKLQDRANTEELNRFDFQFLDAIRDVESQLFSGRNTLLKEVLSYFLDYDLNEKPKEEKNKEIEDRSKKFQEGSGNLIRDLKERIDTKPILKYAKEVGASIGGRPDFEGEITEVELFAALRLIIERNKKRNIKIPVTNNGLGYNNLIFISALLAKMQMSCTNYENEDEQKVFPMLLIEEPEAHLHPSLQFKFLKFLKEQLKEEEKEKEKVRQIFITTHSTHIAAAVDLDEIIVLNVDSDNKLNIAYPGKVFEKNDYDKKSKAYIKRFLDATKSDMLFARGTILVEGISEQLLMSCFAKYYSKEKGRELSIEDNHIAVLNVGGKNFEHFLKLFGSTKCALNKKIACIIDADPSRKEKEENSHFEICYPFELDAEHEKFHYKKISDTIEDINSKYQDHNNIKICYPKPGKGKTFEFELAFANPKCKILLTDKIANKKELENLMEAYEKGKSLKEMMEIVRNEQLKEKISAQEKNSIHSSKWSDEEMRRALIAARYLESVENGLGKGEHALELMYILENNLENGNIHNFCVPRYIGDAIEWICNDKEAKHGRDQNNIR